MGFLKAIYHQFMKSDTFEKGAALSYYTVFSFLPITMIISSLLGILFKEDNISDELYKVIQNIVGDQGALQFMDIIRNQHLYHDNWFTTVVGMATLLLAATGMFNQIQKSLNAVWGLKAKPKKSVINYFARHFASLIMLLFLGFILLLSTTLNSLFLKYASYLPDAFVHAHLYENVISFFLITLLFTILFRFIGNAIVPLKTAFVSAGFTAFLFFIGKTAIGFYIAHSDIKSTFGAASAIALLMIWVYYTSQILFVGAAFAYVFGQKTGAEIKPTNQAIRYVHKELI